MKSLVARVIDRILYVYLSFDNADDGRRRSEI